MSLQESLSALTDLSRAAIFNAKGEILASTFSITDAEIKALSVLFNSYDDAYRNGALIGGTQFEIFKYFPEQTPALLYGRTEEEEKEGGEGFCLLKTKSGNGDEVFFVSTYCIPILSAKAVPQMITFAAKFLSK
eukprot:ANDGO_06792.mRNA.1 hypothetical protein GUITHDRAFT_152952